MAWGWDESAGAHEEVYGEPRHHESKLSHELIAGAASFEGMKLWEDYQRRQGKPVSHAFAKEALAGFVGAEVDKLVETKGLDEMDRLRAHEHARRNAEQMYDQHYVDRYEADQYDPDRYGRHERFDSYERRRSRGSSRERREEERWEDRREEERWEDRREEERWEDRREEERWEDRREEERWEDRREERW